MSAGYPRHKEGVSWLISCAHLYQTHLGQLQPHIPDEQVLASPRALLPGDTAWDC